MATIKDYQGKSFDVDTLKSLAQQLNSYANLKGMSGGVYGTKKSSVGFSYKDLSGALGAEPTVYDQVLMDAARGLLKKGITDISQLRTENGKVYNGDKLLGRGTSIQIGETFTGEGKTTYSLNLKGDTPSFSTAGAGTGFFDSSLGKLATAATAVFGGPIASAALAGAKTLDAGGDLGDALESGAKAGLLTYGGQQLASSLGGTTDVGGSDVTGADMGSGGGNAVDLGTATGADLSTAYDMGNIGDLGAGGPVTTADIVNAIATPAKIDPYEIYGSSPSQFGGGGEYIDLAAQSGLDLGGVGASPNTWMTEGNYGVVPEAAPSSTPAGSNVTLKDVVDATKAGLFINAVTGDPLGLSGSTGGTSSGSTGFDIVPVPTEWKSPTYSYTPAQNVTFEDLFPGVSLQGTQWAGLQNAKPNVSFNDIFAAGLQSTPKGTPVNIGDIVGAIVGQNAKS